MWTLAKRLIHTAKIPSELVSSRDWLRKAKIKNSSKLRNKFFYDDHILTPIETPDYSDFPNPIALSILAESAPNETKHQFLIAFHISKYCQYILTESGLGRHLSASISEARIQDGFTLASNSAA